MASLAQRTTADKPNAFARFFTYRRRLSLTGMLFILPALLYFSVFAFWPMLNAFYLSLFDFDLFSIATKEFIGLDQYSRLLTDPTFGASFRTTAIYAFGVSVPIWIISMVLALLLNQNIRFRTFFRTVFFAPIVVPLAVLAIVWALLYHPSGPINSFFLAPFVREAIPWLNTGQYALLAVIIMAVWRAAGYYGVIFLAGLQGIPNEYYEAARLDGANAAALFRYVTWPLLRPTTVFVVVVSLINALRHFDAIWIMTQGGPGDATRVLSVLIYETGLRDYDMGRASAMSVFLFLAALVFTVIQLRLFSTDDHA